MLIITRRPGETIMIGDGIAVTVMSMAGGEVRVGITAPRDQRILRGEIYGRTPAPPGGLERVATDAYGPEVTAAAGGQSR